MQKDLEQLQQWKIEITALQNSQTVGKEQLDSLNAEVCAQNEYLIAESNAMMSCKVELDSLFARLRENRENQDDSYFRDFYNAQRLQQNYNDGVGQYEPRRIAMSEIVSLVAIMSGKKIKPPAVKEEERVSKNPDAGAGERKQGLRFVR